MIGSFLDKESIKRPIGHTTAEAMSLHSSSKRTLLTWLGGALSRNVMTNLFGYLVFSKFFLIPTVIYQLYSSLILNYLCAIYSALFIVQIHTLKYATNISVGKSIASIWSVVQKEFSRWIPSSECKVWLGLLLLKTEMQETVFLSNHLGILRI